MNVARIAASGVGGPDPLDHRLEPLPPPTGPCLQHRRRDVLEREVEVGARRCPTEHRVDQLVGDSLGMQIHQPDPLEPSIRSSRCSSESDEIALAGVPAPHHRVLAHERQLRDALRRPGGGLGSIDRASERERNFPRISGIAQNVQPRSQPSAIFR